MAKNLHALVCSVAGLVLVAATAAAADWPHWMGPNRDGSSPEKGLLLDWPKEGPKLLWKVDGGDGYSSVAVVGGRAFTLVQRGDEELAIALDVAKGKELWKTPLGPKYENEYGNGPRSTPAIDGKHVYVHSVNGVLACLKIDNGEVVWKQDLFKEFKGKNLTWGVAASPLVDGDLVFAIPGSTGAGIAAFDKTSGKLAWKATDDKAGYASPNPITVDGKKQILFFTAPGVRGVDPKTGESLWTIPWVTEYDCNICTPLVIGNQFFVSSGEKVGSGLYKLEKPNKPTPVWESKGVKGVMTNYWANAVVHDGHLYGISGEFSSPVINLNCVDLANGKLKWSKERFGKGSITLADGHLFITTKAGDLVLAPATPKGYEEKARVKLLGENRTVPTIADKKLFLRDRKSIYCLDIAGK